MKILFFRPAPSPETIGLQHVMLVEPLELETLAALVPSGDTPVIIDLVLEKKPFSYFLNRETPDVVCVTGYITNVPEMISICRTAKTIDPGITTMAGGVHCEVCPEDLDDEAIDFRVVRNAISVFPQLLEHSNGKGEKPAAALSPGEPYDRGQLPDFDFNIPFPKRDLTARYRHRYFYIFHEKVALLKTAFGCPHSCSFCFCRLVTSGKYTARPLTEVVRELAAITEKEVYIVDDDFLLDEDRLRGFIQAVRAAGIAKHYLVYGRADFIAAHPELIRDLKSVGLRTVIVGIESFWDTELEQYNKHTDAEANERAVKILHQNKIDCYATVIVPPHWGPDEFRQCRDTLKRLGIHYVNLQPLTPLPHTGLPNGPKGLLLDRKNFAKWDLAHVAYKPDKMPVAEFYRSILKLYNAILFRPRVLFRYLIQYRPRMLWKMLKGSFLIRLQYLKKIKEARGHA